MYIHTYTLPIIRNDSFFIRLIQKFDLSGTNDRDSTEY